MTRFLPKFRNAFSSVSSTEKIAANRTCLRAEDSPLEMSSHILCAAAQLVEDTAFNLAGTCDTGRISQLIIIAADLERIAGEVGEPEALRQHAR